MDKTNIKREVSTGVIIGRFLLLLAAVAAFVGSVAISRSYDHAASASSERYVCPMHPQVVSGVPGDCPICKMALERVRDTKQTQTIEATRRAFDEVKRRVIAQVVRAPASIGSDGVVTAVVYKESLNWLTPGYEALLFRSASPAKAVSVRLTSEPPTPWDASTVQVRFVSAELSAFDGETGWLQFDAQPRELLVVPASSLLYSGEGAYVLAAAAGGHNFTRRAVQVGRILDSGYASDQAADRFGTVVVLSGLNEGERVVTNDTFFLDAERRLRAAQGKIEEVVE
ncbi:MAG TPA: heavy metal-binding domain-containing protein [Polyangiaceae bacterium]